MTRRTRWHLLNYGPAVLLAILTAPVLALGGDWFAAVSVLMAALVVALQVAGSRPQYKGAWYAGRVALMLELRGRQPVQTLPRAPKPWDPPPPPWCPDPPDRA